MSSGVNPINANDSTMPGDYESLPAPAARGGLLTGRVAPSQPMIPPTRTPFPRIPPAPSTARLPGRTPFPRIPPASPTTGLPMRRQPIVPRVRLSSSHRRRRRPLTPDIVIERRPHHHSSGRRHRVITVPLDHRPTLGLRGPPKRVIEIERVRCHRRRRSPSICYEYDYDYDDPLPPPPPLPSQPPVVVANPIANPYLPPAQPTLAVPVNNTAAVASSAFLSNLTQETIDNLPKQTIHLPPIHLPGSQADANTELDTVIFPAEIINPANGTLSIIQANPGANNVGTTQIQPSQVNPVQPQLISIPTTVGVPAAPRGLSISPAMASNPLMQRFQELFQRINIPQTRPISSASNPPMIRPTLPTMSQFGPSNNTVNNPPIISSINTANVGGYPSGNIRPTNPLNIGSSRPANITPAGLVSNMSYRPSTFTPSSMVNNATYRPPNIAPSDTSDIGPYRPANITPYANIANRSSNNPVSKPSFSFGPTAYTSAPSVASSSTFTPFPSLSSLSPGLGNNSINPASSSVSLAPTPNQTINSTPKSILRGGSSTGLPNTTNTGLNSPIVTSLDNVARKTTRFT